MSSTKVVLNLTMILALLLGTVGLSQAQVIPLKVEFPADGIVNVGQNIEISNGSNTLLGNREVSDVWFDGVHIGSDTNPNANARYGLIATVGTIVANGTLGPPDNTIGMTDVVKTDGNGNFRISFRVPELEYGNHTITIGGRQINVKIVGRIASVIPFSVKIDDAIQVIGNGFTPGKKVSVRINGIQQAEVVADGLGSFNANIPVVEAPYGLNNMQAADLENTSNVAESVNVIFVNPRIKAFDGGNRKVGDELTVKARGLPANGAVSITVGGVAATITAGGTANANGTVEAKYLVPHLNAGWKTLKVQVGSVSISQGNAHNIVANLISIAPTHGTLGTSVTLGGTGYGSWVNNNVTVGEDVRVDIKDPATGNLIVGNIAITAGGIASVTGGTAGDLSVTITMPDLPNSGNVDVVVTGNKSGTSAKRTFLYSIPASADRTLWISKNAVKVGDVIAVTGFNYPPNAVVGNLIVKQGDNPNKPFTTVLQNVTAGPDGVFMREFTTPLKPAGPDTAGGSIWYVVDTSAANLQADNPVAERRFQIGPKVTSVGPTSILAWHNVTVAANGFYSEEDVKFTIGLTSKVVKSNTSGEATATIQVGPQPYGDKNVSAEAVASAARTHVSGTKVKINNRIWDVKVNAAGGKNGTAVNIGDVVRVQGNGWDAGPAVEVKFGGVVVTNTVTDGNGNLDASFNVPNMGDTGTFTISVKSEAGGNDATETTLDRGGAGLALSIRSKDATPIASATKEGFVGDTVTVKGTQLSASKDFGKITFAGAAMDISGDGKIDGADDVKSDSSGNFVVAFTVPAMQAGFYNIVLPGSTVGFTVKGKITSVTSGNKNVGDEIVVKVTGYPAGNIPSPAAAGDGVFLAGTAIALTTNDPDANADGARELTFNIPAGDAAASTAGLKKVKVKLGGTEYEVNGPNVVPKIVLNPNSGQIGEPIQIAGTGFEGNERVTASFDGVELNEERANLAGEVAITINAPGRPIGARTVKALGNVSNLSATASFTMQPSASLTPASGTNETVVTITGNGMQANETLDVDIVSPVDGSGDTDIPTVHSGSLVADAAGTFTFAIKIGVDTNKLTFGTKNIIVRGISSDRQIAMVFNVIGRVTSMTPTAGPAGTQIVIQGDGYGKEEHLLVDIGPAANLVPKDNPKTSADGSFTITVGAPGNQTYGDKAVRVKSLPAGSNENHAAGNFGMRGRIYKITIQSVTDANPVKDKNKKVHVGVGDLVAIHADGLSGSGGKLDVTVGGVKYIDNGNNLKPGGGHYGNDGIINNDERFRIDDRPFATGMAVVVQDDKQTLTANGPRNDEGVGALDIDPLITTVERTVDGAKSGDIGDRVKVVGRGFRAGQVAVNILVAGVGKPQVIRATTSSDANGVVGVLNLGEFIIPVGTPYGQLTVTVTDGVASDTDTSFTVSQGNAGPKLLYTDGSTIKSAKPGDQLTIVGVNYPPNSGVGSLSVGGIAVVAALNSDANGSFRTPFNVPEVTEGNKNVTTTGVAPTVAKVNVQNKIAIQEPNNQYYVGEWIYFRANGLPNNVNLSVALQEVAGSHAVTRTVHNADNFRVKPPAPAPFLDNPLSTDVLDSGNLVGFRATADGVVQGYLKVPTFPESPSNYQLVVRNASTGVEIKGQITSPTGVQKRYNADTYRVQGNGYRAGEIVQVTFGAQQVNASANADGVFDTGNQTLVGQEQGTKTVIAIGLSSGEADKDNVSGTNTLLDILPRIALTGNTSGPVGTETAISGTGFEGGKKVQLFVRHPNWGAGGIVKELNANGDGGFSTTISMPTRPGGVNTVVGLDDTSGREYSLPFVVTGRVTKVEHSTRTVGSEQIIEGDGMGWNQPINLEMAPSGGARTVLGGFINDLTGNTNAAADGKYKIKFNLPPVPAGAKDIYISTQSAATPLKSSAFTVVPGNVKTKLASGQEVNAGGPSTTIYVTGDGFPADTVVQVNFGGVVVTTSPVNKKTAGNGDYDASFQIPALNASGVKTVVFTAGSFSTSINFTYSLAGSGGQLQVMDGASMTLPGVVKVRGFGYLSGANLGNLAMKAQGQDDLQFVPVNVAYIGTGGWQVVANQIIADQHGIFEVQFPVPAVVGGIKVLDTRQPGHAAVLRGEFTVNKKLELTPTNHATRGTAGIQVQLTGFAANTILGKVDYAGRTFDLTSAGPGTLDDKRAKTDAVGQFTGTFNLPLTGAGTSAGNHTVSLGGQGATFRIDALGNGEIYDPVPNPIQVDVADPVSFKARGFVANEDVKITLAGNPAFEATVQANANGELSYGFNVPVRAYNLAGYEIKAEGTQEVDGNKVQATANLQITGNVTAFVPAEGVKGAWVTVTGNGFGANELLTLHFGGLLLLDGNVDPLVKARADGTFALSFQVPEYKYGNVNVTVTGLASGQPGVSAFKVKSTISVVGATAGHLFADPAAAVPGTNAQVRGYGFVPGENVTVKVGSDEIATNVPVDPNGSFDTGLRVLDTRQTYGSKNVVADAPTDATDTTLSGAFMIEPNIHFNPATGRYNLDNIDVSWTGYTGGAVNVYIGGVIAINGSNADTADNGSGQKTVKVPAVPVGKTAVRVTDTTGTPSKESAADAFEVTQASTDIHDIVITDDAGSGGDLKGYVGTLLTVTGVGFGKNDGTQEWVNITFERKVAGVLKDVIMHQVFTSNGTFSTSGFQVPTVIGGIHKIKAIGQTSGKQISKDFEVQPRIITFPAAGRPGDVVSLTGTGGGENQAFTSVRMKVLEGTPFDDNNDGTPDEFHTFPVQTSAADGTFVMNLQLPNGAITYTDTNGDGRIPTQIEIVDAAGTLDIAFTDFTSIALTTAAPQYTIQVKTPTPDAVTGIASGPADTRITIMGTATDGAGLPLRNADIGNVLLSAQNLPPTNVTVAAHNLVASKGSLIGDKVRTGDSGEYEVSFNLKSTAGFTLVGGNTTIQIQNAATGFNVQGKIDTPNANVAPGGVVTLNGFGYFGIVPVGFKMGPVGQEVAVATVPASVITDVNGAFNGVTIAIPADMPGGQKRIVALGPNDDIATAPTLGVLINIAGQINAPTAAAPAQAQVGGELTIAGFGLGAAEEIAVNIGGVAILPEDVVSGGTTAADGSFATTVKVPALPGGLHGINITGTVSGVVIGEANAVSIAFLAAVTPDTGSVGVEVTISGQGFAPNEAITVAFGVLTDAVVTQADANGSFSEAYLIDQVQAGALAVVVTGATSGAVPLTLTYDDVVGPVVATVAEDSAGAVLKPGDVLTVTVTQRDAFDTAVSGAFTLGDDITAPLALAANGADPATWTGTYTIKAGDLVKGLAVNATLTDAADNVGAAGASDTTVQVDGLAEVDTVAVTPTTPAKAGTAITVVATGEAGGTATFSIPGVDGATDVAMVENPEGTYTGSYAVAEGDTAKAKVTVNLTDALGNTGEGQSDDDVVLDTSVAITDAKAEAGVLTVTTEADATVVAEVTKSGGVTEEVALTATDAEPTVYTAALPAGAIGAAITVTDAAGNVATAQVDLATSFTIALQGGLNFIHVPVADAAVTTLPGAPKLASLDGLAGVSVADVFEALGSNVLLVIYYDTASGTFQSYSDFNDPSSLVNIALQPYTGLIAVMKTGASSKVTFEGPAYAQTTVELKKGSKGLNLVGLPTNAGIAMVSDLVGLSSGIVAVTAQNGAALQTFPPVDNAITGGQGLLVTVTDDVTLDLDGQPWENDAAAVASPSLSAQLLNPNQTGAFVVEGHVALEATQMLLDNMNVTVRNLTTNASLNNASGSVAGEGKFSVAFVDTAGRAASVGDTLEISIDDASGRYGAEPIRHIVTRDDILNGHLQLDIHMVEVPEESALLANYPNPFNPETWIPFHLSDAMDVRLSIFDATGRLVRTLDLGYKTAGMYESRAKAAYWDGRNAHGERVASGVYFYRMEAGEFNAMRKMLIVK